MQRSRRIVVMAHCILNSNSKVRGLSSYSGALEPVVLDYIGQGVGIIQLPCPEMTFLGLKRWGMTREQYDTAAYRKHCRKLVGPYIDQIQEYLANDYAVECIIGIDGSPSCGVNFTCTGYSGGEMEDAYAQLKNLRELPGRGVMFEILAELLAERGINIPFVGIDEKEPYLPVRC